jgi:protein SCO1/2
MKKFLVLICIALLACDSGLPVKGELPNLPLKDQDGKKFTFSELKGKVLIVSYTYTHCPDVCPMTIKRMKEIESGLKGNGLQDGVYFVSISLDPKRDTPEAIREYARKNNSDLRNWFFLTGNEVIINSIMKAAGVVAMKDPTQFTENKEPYYFIIHTDRISLVDKKGRIRKNYKGSSFDKNELLTDIEKLM